MTAIGVACCVALLFSSTALYNSASQIVPYQFGPIVKYDTSIKIDSAKLNINAEAEFKDFVQNKQYFEDFAFVSQQQCYFPLEDLTDVSVTLLCPKDYIGFSEFYDLHNRHTGEKYELNDNSVILNENLASMLNVKEGDSFALNLGGFLGYKSNETITLKCTGICEFYVQNYVFVGSQALQEALAKKSDFMLNYDYVLCKNKPNISKDTLMQAATSISVVDNVNFVDTHIDSLRESLKLATTIVTAFLAFSILMCVLVLYCITNISFLERIREFATFKTIGYAGREIHSMLFREIFAICTIGILLGLLLGILASYIIIPGISGIQVMYVMDLSLDTFAISILGTYLVTIVFVFTIRFKVNRIDMVKELNNYE
ncbi:MAG: FtsX-like permease family protein [Enterococcus sp.]|nr:FtsX-like permease family protein [Enterococcus sp.]